MFWEKWIPEKYILGSHICGLEIIVGNEDARYYYTILEHHKNKLSIMDSGELSDPGLLEKKLQKKKIPVAICVNGKGLVFKKVTGQENKADHEAALLQAFPTINKGEFYLQYYKQLNCDGFISLYRKEQIDKVINTLTTAKLEIAAVYLGYGFMADVIPLVNLFNTIETNNAEVELLNGCIENIRVKENIVTDDYSVTVEGMKLDRKSMVAFSLGFAWLLNTSNCYNYNDEIKLFAKRYIEKKKLKLLMYFFVGSAFLLCMVNFFCFNYYFNANRTLESKLSEYEIKYQKVDELLEKYERQKGVIEDLGFLDPLKFSKYTDKIAATIPKEVTLSDWIIGLPIEKNEEDSLQKFSENKIELKGNCNKSLIINEWVNVLKMQEFIKEVNLKQFLFDNGVQGPNFELQVILK